MSGLPHRVRHIINNTPSFYLVFLLLYFLAIFLFIAYENGSDPGRYDDTDVDDEDSNQGRHPVLPRKTRHVKPGISLEFAKLAKKKKKTGVLDMDFVENENNGVLEENNRYRNVDKDNDKRLALDEIMEDSLKIDKGIRLASKKKPGISLEFERLAKQSKGGALDNDFVEKEDDDENIPADNDRYNNVNKKMPGDGFLEFDEDLHAMPRLKRKTYSDEKIEVKLLNFNNAGNNVKRSRHGLEALRNQVHHMAVPQNSVKKANSANPSLSPQPEVKSEIGHGIEVDIPIGEDYVKPPHDPDAPGEYGKSVKIVKSILSPEDKKKYDEGWENNAFNEYASDMISLHRMLPDPRDPECRQVDYHADLPDTSVLICFHNEAMSVLLRTVHSVIDTVPEHLLKEIILIDDASTMSHLQKPLETHLSKLGGKVRLLRAEKREGLIRARLMGFAVATASTVTFLDSHCECAVGWIEPLLDRVAIDDKNVAIPVIDAINDDTFKFGFQEARHTFIGGFDWTLQFSWHAVPPREAKERNHYTDPLKTPTMAGGLFTISRHFFEKIGTYDPGFDIWGGENLEISFKVWMCGGRMDIVPCSHVGHVFRKRSPYSWGTKKNVMKRNTIRLAEVWMDEYKNFYYDRINNDLGDYGDVSDRKALRKSLQCQSFKWYLENVYPDMFIPSDSLAMGEIRRFKRPTCLDKSTDHKSIVDLYICNNGSYQHWYLTKTGEIRNDFGQCFDYNGRSWWVGIKDCHGMGGYQAWKYRTDGSIYHPVHQRCAEADTTGKKLMMMKCAARDRQVWLWSRVTPSGD